jgi:hypothetical protein
VTVTGSSTKGVKTVLHPAFDLAAAKATPDGNVLGLLQHRYGIGGKDERKEGHAVVRR